MQSMLFEPLYSSQKIQNIGSHQRVQVLEKYPTQSIHTSPTEEWMVLAGK